jgi:hypothetical protein
MRAVPALRILLPQVGADERINVVGALLACGGFSVGEQIEALELTAKNPALQNNYNSAYTSTVNPGASMSNQAKVYPDAISETHILANTSSTVNSATDENSSRPYNPAELKHILGSQLAMSTEVSDELVAAMVDRISYLDAKDTQLAFNLRKIMLNWKGGAVNSLLLRDLKKRQSGSRRGRQTFVHAQRLREKQSNDVFDIRSSGAAALGISACLLEDNNEYGALLEGDNTEAKTAMLACARLIRANLPVRKVAENLQSSNAVLALAAERYLESEDSPEARSLVLARHPNEAKFSAQPRFLPETAAPSTRKAVFSATCSPV